MAAPAVSAAGVPPGRRAFTLVELIVVAMVMSMLLAFGFRFFTQFSHSIAPKVSDRLFLQMEARNAADVLIRRIREGSDIVRPLLGETCPFLLLKDSVNHMTFFYLEADQPHTQAWKKKVYRLVTYSSDYSGTYRPDQEKILLDSIRRLTFTPISPDSVQINATLANAKEDFEFVANVGVMNLGSFDE
ncbi:MAG: type II secretion system protein [Candidatus Riflebacteria bacterium]|nr:type II secretion system protein [Candidatus Riflebacteria bacterium]